MSAAGAAAALSSALPKGAERYVMAPPASMTLSAMVSDEEAVRTAADDAMQDAWPTNVQKIKRVFLAVKAALHGHEALAKQVVHLLLQEEAAAEASHFLKDAEAHGGTSGENGGPPSRGGAASERIHGVLVAAGANPNGDLGPVTAELAALIREHAHRVDFWLNPHSRSVLASKIHVLLDHADLGAATDRVMLLAPTLAGATLPSAPAPLVELLGDAPARWALYAFETVTRHGWPKDEAPLREALAEAGRATFFDGLTRRWADVDAARSARDEAVHSLDGGALTLGLHGARWILWRGDEELASGSLPAIALALAALDALRGAEPSDAPRFVERDGRVYADAAGLRAAIELPDVRSRVDGDDVSIDTPGNRNVRFVHAGGGERPMRYSTDVAREMADAGLHYWLAGHPRVIAWILTALGATHLRAATYAPVLVREGAELIANQEAVDWLAKSAQGLKEAGGGTSFTLETGWGKIELRRLPDGRYRVEGGDRAVAEIAFALQVPAPASAGLDDLDAAAEPEVQDLDLAAEEEAPPAPSALERVAAPRAPRAPAPVDHEIHDAALRVEDSFARHAPPRGRGGEAFVADLERAFVHLGIRYEAVPGIARVLFARALGREEQGDRIALFERILALSLALLEARAVPTLPEFLIADLDALPAKVLGPGWGKVRSAVKGVLRSYKLDGRAGIVDAAYAYIEERQRPLVEGTFVAAIEAYDKPYAGGQDAAVDAYQRVLAAAPKGKARP